MRVSSGGARLRAAVAPRGLERATFSCSVLAQVWRCASDGDSLSRFDFVSIAGAPSADSDSTAAAHASPFGAPFRTRSYYFERAARERGTPLPEPHREDVARRELREARQRDAFQRAGTSGSDRARSPLSQARRIAATTTSPLARAAGTRRAPRGGDDDGGADVASMGAKLGGAEGRFIARRQREASFIGRVGERADTMWYQRHRHLRRQDALVRELGSVEAAVGEILQPTRLSFTEELRRRPLDRAILTDIYRESHGLRAERLLRKGVRFERWVARGESNLPVVGGSQRARTLFGFGGGVTLAAEARSGRDFPQLNAPEVAFIGKTNSGRSSLINAVFNAFVCKHGAMPGTTVTANFYNVADRMTIVDLPGYGFYNPTQTPMAVAESAAAVLDEYLHVCSAATSTRPRNVKRVFLCTHAWGLSRSDIAYAELLERNRVPFGVIMTKTDLTPVRTLARVADYTRSQLAPFAMCNELMMAGALRLAGISQLQNTLAELARASEQTGGANAGLDLDLSALV
jgi:GTP-binding protein EngB required for normal cell division